MMLVFPSAGCFGGPIGVTSSPIPDDDDVFDALGIPAPSDQQLLCIDVQAQARGADFVTACSDLIQGPDEEPVRDHLSSYVSAQYTTATTTTHYKCLPT